MKFPCLFCGGEFGGAGGLKRHLHYCMNSPNAKLEIASDLEIEISEDGECSGLPCLYCGNDFNNQNDLTAHLMTCK